MAHKPREILECASFCFSENKNKKDPLNQEKIFFALFSFQMNRVSDVRKGDILILHNLNDALCEPN